MEGSVPCRFIKAGERLVMSFNIKVGLGKAF